ncbi:736_t:CDS:2, partial [Funneliformis geosporum]
RSCETSPRPAVKGNLNNLFGLLKDLAQTLKNNNRDNLLNESGANHKDQWAVVKPKSASERVKILPDEQLERMKGELTEKQSLLHAMDQRKRNVLLSPQDQVKYDQLTKEITKLQKQLA